MARTGSRSWWTDVPSNTVPGIWVRDTLAEKGRLISGTRLDFETREGGFTSLGRAFEQWPTRGNAPGQGPVEGAEGGFINSFHPTLGHAATGTLRSAPFELRGDYLLFATLELTDDSPDPWGYIALDALAQRDAAR